MNSLEKRILLIKEEIPSREDWNYKLKREAKFPNNRDKLFCDKKYLKIKKLHNILTTYFYDYGLKIDFEVLSIRNIFINVFNHYNILFKSDDDFYKIDDNLSYDDLMSMCDLALKYAKNWNLS